jgi:putative transposase
VEIMSQVVDAAMIAQAIGISRRSATRRAEKECWFRIVKIVQGGKQFVYPVSTLPQDVHKKVAALLMEQELATVSEGNPEALRNMIAQTIENDTRLPLDIRMALCERELAAETPSLPTVMASALPTSQLTDNQRRVAEARMALLAEIDRLAHATSVKTATLKICELAAAGKLASRLADLIPIANARSTEGRMLSPRTLKRWRALRRDGGFAMLAPKDTNPATVAPWWAEGLLRHWQKPQKPALTEALALFTAELVELGLEPPSYDQARAFIRALGTVERNRGRLGSRELKTLKPFVKRDDSELDPLDVVLMDGHQYDAEIAHPFHGGPFRPEITTVIDAKTRMALGFSTGLAESAQAVMDAIRDAVLRFGVPAILYTDRGSGNLAEVVSGPVLGLLARIGIRHEKSIAYNSQARGRSERSHATIWVASAKKRATYIGKPMDAQAKQLVHKLTRRDLAGKGKAFLPAWRDFVEDCKRDVAAYNASPHRSLPTITDPVNGKRRNQSPMEAWMAAIEAGWTPIMLPATETEDLFRPHRKATVRRCVIAFQNLEYSHNDLFEFHGEEVQVAYEPTDAAHVWVKTMDGRLICKATLDGHKRGYMPMSVVEQAKDAREASAIRLHENHIKVIRAERRGEPLEMEIANLAEDVQLVRPAEIIELRPARDPHQIELEKKEGRFARYLAIGQALAMGGEVSDSDRSWHASYGRDPECTSRLRVQRMVAEGQLTG